MNDLNLQSLQQGLAQNAQALGFTCDQTYQNQLGSGQLISSGIAGGYTYGGYNSLQQCGSWIPARTAVGDFLKVQYAEVETRCAITRKTIPAGSPVMLLGGMIISQAAFENWLEENLAGMISRHQDLHTDNSGYDE